MTGDAEFPRKDVAVAVQLIRSQPRNVVIVAINDEPVSSVDFAPTLAGLAGIRVPDDLDGRRVMP